MITLTAYEQEQLDITANNQCPTFNLLSAESTAKLVAAGYVTVTTGWGEYLTVTDAGRQAAAVWPKSTRKPMSGRAGRSPLWLVEQVALFEHRVIR